MDYRAHYDCLVSRARGRVLPGYRERHHILPRCMGGTDDPTNLVDLTAEEHYVAHQLLVKIYPNVRGLAYAAVRMARQCTGSRAYGWLRRRVAEAKAEAQQGVAPFAGRRHTEATRARMSAVRRGRKNSAEHRARVSAALLGNKRGSGNRGKTRSQAEKDRISEFRKGRRLSQEHKDAIAASMRGKKFPPRSAEFRARMSAMKKGNQSCLGRVMSPETRAKIGVSQRARLAARRASEEAS